VGKRRDVKTGDTLVKEDKALSILTGIGILKSDSGEASFDKKSEMSYMGDADGKVSYKLTQGRVWVESKKEMTLSLKHIDATLAPDTIALLEQQPIHSIVYILQ
jgi:hypothetical protein